MYMEEKPEQNNLISADLLAELKRIELRTRRRIDSSLAGRYRSAFRGSGLVFTDIREYQPGDDIRHIHWKVSARTGRVYVKSFEEDRQLRVMLLVDMSASTRFGSDISKYQRALQFAALITLLSQQNQDAVGLCLFASSVETYIPPSRKRTQTHRILAELMTHRKLTSGTDIASASRYLQSMQQKPSVIFLISDFHSPDYEDSLRRLSFRHDVIGVYCNDPLENNFVRAGLVEFVDPESGERFLCDTSQPGFRDRIGLSVKKHITTTQSIFSRAGADFLQIQEHPVRELSRFMNRRLARMH